MMTYVIVGSMLVAGAVGGLINYFLIDPKEESPLAWWKLMIVGVGASFMVPVLLNMISSELIADIEVPKPTTDPVSKLLILTGFCLLAAVSSRAFIRTLTDRVLRDVAVAKEQSAEALETSRAAKEEVELIVEPQATPFDLDLADAQAEMEQTQPPTSTPVGQYPEFANQDDDVGSDSSPKHDAEAAPQSAGDERALFSEPDAEAEAGAGADLSRGELRLLSALIRTNFALRTLPGLSRDSGLSPSRALTVLQQMKEKGLVESMVDSKGSRRFSATLEGRERYRRGREKT